MKLVFATNNQHKINEIQQMLDGRIELLGLSDIGFSEEIPEEQPSLEGNASQKAWFIFNRFGLPCFADDTGLEVEAINGEPGVYSARYAGEEKNPEANMDKLLTELAEIKNRNARFRTVIALVMNGKEIQFEGVVSGTILHEKRGSGGFGYDPIFQPDESDYSFAEMPAIEKNKISHRGRAVNELLKYLQSITIA